MTASILYHKIYLFFFSFLDLDLLPKNWSSNVSKNINTTLLPKQFKKYTEPIFT